MLFSFATCDIIRQPIWLPQMINMQSVSLFEKKSTNMEIDKVSSIITYMVLSLILSCQIKMYHIVIKEYVYEVSIYLVGPVLIVISGRLTFSAEGSHFPRFSEIMTSLAQNCISVTLDSTHVLTFVSAEGCHFPNVCENNDITTLTCAPLDPA